MSKIVEITSGLDLESLKLNDEVNEAGDFSSVLINSSVDGIITYDLNAAYTRWSPAMERMTGLKSEDVIGRNAFQVFPFLKKYGMQEAYEKSLRGESVQSPLLHYRIPGTGKEGYSQQQNFPLFDDEGKVTGGMAIVRDITAVVTRLSELTQRNQALEARVAELEDLIKRVL